MKNSALILIFFMCLTGFKLNNARVLSGSVFEKQSKQPLPGVSVMIAGTNIGTITDEKGAFSLTVPEGSDKLVFSLVGYLNKTVSINSYDKFKIYLEADQKSLNEVVVTNPNVNYDRNKKVLIRGRMNQALAGKAAGVAVSPAPMMTSRAKLGNTVYESEDKTNYRNQRPSSAADENTESYKKINENPFLNTVDNPLSTFSADVDAGSYSNVRRFINNGSLPPADAVRIEEMINYFKYEIPGPVNSDPVAIHTELAAAPWNSRHSLLRIGLKARSIETSKLPASNLVFLIDVSGSMLEPNKLPLVQSALKLLVDQLRAVDKVSIVVYAGNAGKVLDPTSGDKKEKIREAIDALEAGGSTAGGEGIKLAYKIASQEFIKGGNNRVILATDGDFNVGASSDEDMETLIVKERESGVFLSVLGFGMGNYKDSKMETLADKGNGNYAYIDNITEARKTLVSEFGGTLFTVAKDVKIQIEFNPANVSAYRLIGYEDRILNKEDFNNDKKDAGDMGSGQTVTALYEIIPVGEKNEFSSVDPLRYQKNSHPIAQILSRDLAAIKFRYKDPNGSVSKVSEISVENKLNQHSTDDFRFIASVAELGMLLRNSEFRQQAGFDQLIALAKSGRGKDDEGYRAEFIRLAESAKLMNKNKLFSKTVDPAR